MKTFIFIYLFNLFHPPSLTAPSWVINFTQDALHFVFSPAFGLHAPVPHLGPAIFGRSRWLADFSADVSVLRFLQFGVIWEVGEGSVEWNGGSRRVYKLGFDVEIDAQVN